MKTECERFKVFMSSAEDRVKFIVQAYTNDIIVILKDTNRIRVMIEVIERFVYSSKMKMNVKKHVIALYLLDMNQRRNNLTDNFTFKGQQISNLMSV
jgi:hypothetical protein